MYHAHRQFLSFGRPDPDQGLNQSSQPLLLRWMFPASHSFLPNTTPLSPPSSSCTTMAFADRRRAYEIHPHTQPLYLNANPFNSFLTAAHQPRKPCPLRERESNTCLLLLRARAAICHQHTSQDARRRRATFAAVHDSPRPPRIAGLSSAPSIFRRSARCRLGACSHDLPC